MDSPVLAHELLLGSRAGRYTLFRRLFTGWLVVQLGFFYWRYLIQTNVLGHWLFGSALDSSAAGAFAGGFVETLVGQQLLLTLLATPAFAAGAITDEKARGTLQYLLSSSLTSGEIVVGKLLGRSLNVWLLTLAGLPILGLVGGIAGLSPLLLLAVVAVSLMPLLALGSASLLASVWSRHTRDAVLAVYALGGLAFAGLVLADGVDYFNPLHVLEPVWERYDYGEMLRRMALSALAWGGVTAVCLTLAVWRLRGATLRQLEGQGKQKPVRWWRVRRAAVSDEPLRWKERHVEGLAPLAALRRIPRWLGMTLILAATTLSSGVILLDHSIPGFPPHRLLSLVFSLNVYELLHAFAPAHEAFISQGLVALLLASLVVGIRCSGAVTGERERQTWEALLLTPLPARDLLRGKLWGVIGASYPYLAAYAAPALTLSVLGGGRAFLGVVILLGVTWLAMAFIGAAGLWSSVKSKSSWRSLLSTLLYGYGVGSLFTGPLYFVIGMLFLIIWVTLSLIDFVTGWSNFGRLFASTFNLFFLIGILAVVASFGLLLWYFLRDAEKHVADRERVRHWKEEPLAYRPRRPQARHR